MTACPPTLVPIPYVLQDDAGTARRVYYENETRMVLVLDRNIRGRSHWGSVGVASLENKRRERARVRYRRKVRMPEPKDIGVLGWSDACWKGGVLTLTYEAVLDPSQTAEAELYAFVLH